MATIVCRDSAGRVLVYRRPGEVTLFPGQINGLLGGAVSVGEPDQEAAARELREERGVHAGPRFLFRFLCQGVISPCCLALHAVPITDPVRPDAAEAGPAPGVDWDRTGRPGLAPGVRRGCTRGLRRLPRPARAGAATVTCAARRRPYGPRPREENGMDEERSTR
ncbi:NUDIX domain-containing protein [Streptomyces sp. S3(2020)]|uniref:NUDIX domain-containing protein n=1 Tax=Streptomyces sp. S3(2020) TaxID=2732044 RepID=UPI003216CC25